MPGELYGDLRTVLELELDDAAVLDPLLGDVLDVHVVREAVLVHDEDALLAGGHGEVEVDEHTVYHPLLVDQVVDHAVHLSLEQRVELGDVGVAVVLVGVLGRPQDMPPRG